MSAHRTRYKDKYKLGKSNTVPYIQNEAWGERHYRRKMAALDRQREVEKWCNNHKWSLKINNNGHHWCIYTDERKMMEWFPSSGKFIIGKKWNEGFHVHDVDQLFKVLEAALTRRKLTWTK